MKKSEKFVRNDWVYKRYLLQEPGEAQFYTFDNRSDSIERNATRLAELAAMGQREFSANLRKRQNENRTAHPAEPEAEAHSATQVTSRTPTRPSHALSQPANHTKVAASQHKHV